MRKPLWKANFFVFHPTLFGGAWWIHHTWLWCTSNTHPPHMPRFDIYIYIYPMWGGYLIFVIPTGSLNPKPLKKSESKNHWFWVLQNFNELLGFMKKPRQSSLGYRYVVSSQEIHVGANHVIATRAHCTCKFDNWVVKYLLPFNWMWK